MKSWLLKWKISSAMNEHKPLSPFDESAICRSAQARRFAADAGALSRALKEQLPVSQDCPSLHASIMHAVRSAECAASMQRQFALARWATGAALVLLVGSGIIAAVQMSSHRTATAGIKQMEEASLATAGSVLELGDSIMREAPSAAMAPMYDEMQRLNRDLDGTQKILLASLP